jgi:hypothetical protein
LGNHVSGDIDRVYRRGRDHAGNLRQLFESFCEANTHAGMPAGNTTEDSGQRVGDQRLTVDHERHGYNRRSTRSNKLLERRRNSRGKVGQKTHRDPSAGLVFPDSVGKGQGCVTRGEVRAAPRHEQQGWRVGRL